jgi:DNA-binding NarL/FixJ family response regulator
VITTFDLDEYVHGALQAGATGFLLKDAGPEMLGEAIRAATRGDSLISPSITRRLLSSFARTGRGHRRCSRSTRSPNGRSRCCSPSPAGARMPEIADELHISLSTVKTHVASLMAKLEARNRVEVAMWAYETGRVSD